VTDEVNESGDSDIAKVVRACEERLNPSAEWTPFEGYPGSLALCVLDAIWSVSTRYPITRGVIQRYRGQRRWQGNPDEDGLPELLAFYGAVGTRFRVGDDGHCHLRRPKRTGFAAFRPSPGR
jgi:hypothetical protein